jgi:hypothetical protein
MDDKKYEEHFYVLKSFESRVDDKFCICGTKEDLAKAFISSVECSLSIRELEEIPDGKTLFWIEYEQLNWAGCGGGSSKLFTNLSDAQKWIINHIKESNFDIGELKYSVYPVYRVKKGDLNGM